MKKVRKGQYRIISRIGNIAGSLLFIFVIINIFLFNFVSEYIPHLDLDDLTMPIQLIAFACTLVGCGIMFPAYKMLGANWIDSVQADGQFPIPAAHQLVQTGIYKHMRNPIYLATFTRVWRVRIFNTKSNYNRGFCDSFDRGLFSSSG